MKKIAKGIGNILTGACVINTVIITLLYTIGHFFMNNDGGKAWIPHFGMMWMVLGISVAFSVAERFFALGGNIYIRLAGHFFISLVGFILIFIVGGGYTNRSAHVFIAICIFLILYAAIMGVRLGLKGFFKRKKNAGEDYSSMFDGKGKETSRKK